MAIQLKPKPQCGCGNTQNPYGYCDDTHEKLSKDTDESKK